MSFLTNRWPLVEEALKQLGVVQTAYIAEIRAKFAAISSIGLHLMPDFTLHQVDHSDNIILLLKELQQVTSLQLDSYEAYLLAASAYLHDLGMFFSGHRFEQEILPYPAERLAFCPKSKCDSWENYRSIEGKKTGVQIRMIHNLLSAYWLLNAPAETFGIRTVDKPYLAAICRGHRKANLREIACTCYRTRKVKGGEKLRVGLLAGLLRLADALDFYDNRTPQAVFEMHALDFLANPDALGHWMRHYFVTNPSAGRNIRDGRWTLECVVTFMMPMGKSINGIPYRQFLDPLLDSYVTQVKATDVDINQYPPAFIQALKVEDMRIEAEKEEAPGAPELPPEITREAANSNSQSAPEFLEWLRKPKIVAVDDQPDWRTKIVGLLTDAGYRVEVADNADAARQLITEGTADLAVIDIRLDPNDEQSEEGLDLAEQVKEEYPDLPIIILTGYATTDRVRRALRPTADGDRVAFDVVEKHNASKLPQVVKLALG